MMSPEQVTVQKSKRSGKRGRQDRRAGETGPQGATGPRGPAGTGSGPDDTIFIAAVGCVETSARAAAEFLVVVNICTQVGHRLLTSAELLAIAASSDTGVSIGLTTSEWSGTVVSETLAIIVGQTDIGTEALRNLPNQYHCLVMPAIVTDERRLEICPDLGENRPAASPVRQADVAGTIEENP